MRKLTALVLVPITLLCGAEVAARLSEPGPFSWFDRNPYVENEDLHHVLRPNFEGRWNGSWYATNSLGLRGPELPAVGELDATFTVAALGDGRTFGRGVVESDCWPRQLERALFGELTPSRMPSVANLGVSDYSSEDCVHALLEMGSALDPDVVVLGLTRAGLRTPETESVDPDGETSPAKPLPASLLEGVKHLALGRLVQIAIGVGSDPDATSSVELDTSELADLARTSITALAAEAQALDARVVVFLFPDQSQLEESSDDELSDPVRSACEEVGILFVDVLTPLRQRAQEPEASDLYLARDHDHPSPSGYQTVADALVRAMRSEGWLQ